MFLALALQSLDQIPFHGSGPMSGRMLGKNSLPCRMRQGRAFGPISTLDYLDDLFGLSSQDDLAPRLQKGFDPIPDIGDDRGSTGGGLEQAHAGAVSCADHIGTCHVQGEPACRIEGRVLAWRDMIDALDILRPGDISWILRS